ncbi:Long-chain-fatty-acid--CoA ligase, partial [hydrothermal vent metagenome]
STVTESSIHINKRVSITNQGDINPDLAVLLSTSGTTGSSKLVRLSYNNLQVNAESIAEYLGITEDECPITSLPMSYSYGLSVLNSHLLKGATIVLTNGSFILRNFWSTFNKYQCTSFAGVPYSYQLLKKINFEKIDLPTLKTLTQAGGNLSENYQKYFMEISEKKGIKFFVMYGQTEATARISYVPHENLKNKLGSIGIPIPNGELKLYSDGNLITESDREGELVYFGENVMLGYAVDRSSLKNGDELDGVLYTGDLGKMDNDGYFYITGRAKRFIKVFGLRLNLDEVERMIENYLHLPTACIGNDDKLQILIQTEREDVSIEVRKLIKKMYKLHDSVIKVNIVQRIPVTSSGKRDYKRMFELL